MLNVQRILDNLPDEYRLFAEADAEAQGIPIGEYLRAAIIEEARQELGEASVCMTAFH